ncbi:MAG: transporter substrate-binding protein [Paenibacillus sp.]|nr:transporter substrate-binding protein [Paenibacillus sp.]
MNQWYSEKLIDGDYLVTDTKLRDFKVTNEQVGSLVAYVSGGIGKYMDTVTKINPSFELVGAPFPVLRAGNKNKFGMSNRPFYGWGAAITSTSKNPELVIKWLDYAYGPEGNQLFNFGIEGVSYNLENGKPKFTKTILNNRIPSVTLTSDEGSKFEAIMSDVNMYFKEMINKFIMGVEKIDKFDEYVKKLQNMNIEEAIKIQQAALDRYNNRK